MIETDYKIKAVVAANLNTFKNKGIFNIKECVENEASSEFGKFLIELNSEVETYLNCYFNNFDIFEPENIEGCYILNDITSGAFDTKRDYRTIECYIYDLLVGIEKAVQITVERAELICTIPDTWEEPGYISETRELLELYQLFDNFYDYIQKPVYEFFRVRTMDEFDDLNQLMYDKHEELVAQIENSVVA